MKSRRPDPRYAFTLLELVVVLAILALVTGLASREISHVLDQQRYEANRRQMQDLERAVLGTGPQGADEGFVADMGRLPQAVGSEILTLEELWNFSGAGFDLRPATASHGVSASMEDPQVRVPGGWRGPYLRIPFGVTGFRDAWGYEMGTKRNDPGANLPGGAYGRLRDASDRALTDAGQDIHIIADLGGNGEYHADDTGYNRDQILRFTQDRFHAALKGQVEVRDGEDPATPNPGDRLSVRVFGPDPEDPARIRVWNADVAFDINPVIWEIPLSSGVTIGPRVVRAYLQSAAGGMRRSEIRQVHLRAGVNVVNLVVDR